MVLTTIITTGDFSLVCFRAALVPTIVVVWSIPGSLRGRIWILGDLAKARAQVRPVVGEIGGKKSEKKDRRGGRRRDTSPRQCEAFESGDCLKEGGYSDWSSQILLSKFFLSFLEISSAVVCVYFCFFMLLLCSMFAIRSVVIFML